MFLINERKNNVIVVPEAPANIKALVMTSDSILVAWNPPTKTNGVIIKYHVYIEHPDKVRE